MTPPRIMSPKTANSTARPWKIASPAPPAGRRRTSVPGIATICASAATLYSPEHDWESAEGVKNIPPPGSTASGAYDAWPVHTGLASGPAIVLLLHLCALMLHPGIGTY